MKIGFLGNANNYPFMLARAIRRAGHDVQFVLILDPNWRLDRPEDRYADMTPPYPNWVYDAGQLDLWNASRCSTHEPAVVELLHSCDAVVLNQYGLCLAHQIGRPTVALLTGTDLLTLANWSYAYQASAACGAKNFSCNHTKAIVLQFYMMRIAAQRFAIRSAALVNYMPMGITPDGDQTLAQLGVSGSRRTCFLMTDTKAIQPVPPPDNQPIRVFCATRFTWDRTRAPYYTNLDYKGSDIMIRGLGQFVRCGTPLEIHLVKKGEHLDQTMQLVATEGLSNHVIWHEEMTQREVWEQFRLADIVVDQFGNSVVGMAGVDAMAMGRVVIANGRPGPITQAYGSPLPLCQASTPDEICTHLEQLVPDKEKRHRIGTEARWRMEQQFSADRAAGIVLEHLEHFCLDKNAQTKYQRELKAFLKRQSKYRQQEKRLIKRLTQCPKPVSIANQSMPTMAASQ